MCRRFIQADIRLRRHAFDRTKIIRYPGAPFFAAALFFGTLM
jgi:hypothetical protein